MRIETSGQVVARVAGSKGGTSLYCAMREGPRSTAYCFTGPPADGGFPATSALARLSSFPPAARFQVSDWPCWVVKTSVSGSGRTYLPWSIRPLLMVSVHWPSPARRKPASGGRTRPLPATASV